MDNPGCRANSNPHPNPNPHPTPSSHRGGFVCCTAERMLGGNTFVAPLPEHRGAGMPSHIKGWVVWTLLPPWVRVPTTFLNTDELPIHLWGVNADLAVLSTSTRGCQMTNTITYKTSSVGPTVGTVVDRRHLDVRINNISSNQLAGVPKHRS